MRERGEFRKNVDFEKMTIWFWEINFLKLRIFPFCPSFEHADVFLFVGAFVPSLDTILIVSKRSSLNRNVFKSTVNTGLEQLDYMRKVEENCWTL